MTRKKIEKENTLCMVIDIQERLIPSIFNKESVMGQSQKLLHGMKAFNIPIIVTEQYPRGLGNTVAEINTIIDEMECTKFEKTQFSAVTEEFLHELKKQSKKNIVLIGIESHVCVLQTALDLLAEGFSVYIPNDCVGSRTKENYINALEILKTAGVIITNMETILFEILTDASAPEFKTISSIVK